MRIVSAISLIMAAALARGQARLVTTAECGTELCGLTQSGHLADLRWPDFSDLKITVGDFYRERAYAPAWTAQGAPTRAAFSIIHLFKTADQKGLSPEDYDASRWPERLARIGNGNAANEGRFDLALTVCLARYVFDLHFGRANPGLFHSRLDPEHEAFDAQALLRKLVSAPDVEALVREIEPPFDGYRHTERALETYLKMLSGADREALPAPDKTVEPGGSYAGADALARLLRLLGDLREDATPPGSGIYSGALVDAVKRFQSRHGLDEDGRIGKATFAHLNTPLSTRVRQLSFTLERWRWAPHRFARPPIVVNIPEFRLRALDRSYRTELDMKVVVGRAYRHQTPVFGANLELVIFRPYWNVPLSIQRNELVPQVERDRAYFASHGYEVVTASDEVVTTNGIDDATLAKLRSGKLGIRQIPGPDNALGLVKFIFPNEHDVYLHATPATRLFSRTRRDFSHGCVRVEKPVQLAEWVLKGEPSWTPDRIEQAMNGSKTVQANLKAPVPVLIVYATAVVLESGEVNFFEDIYRQDELLSKQLAVGYPTPGLKPTNGARAPRPRE